MVFHRMEEETNNQPKFSRAAFLAEWAGVPRDIDTLDLLGTIFQSIAFQ